MGANEGASPHARFRWVVIAGTRLKFRVETVVDALSAADLEKGTKRVGNKAETTISVAFSRSRAVGRKSMRPISNEHMFPRPPALEIRYWKLTCETSPVQPHCQLCSFANPGSVGLGGIPRDLSNYHPDDTIAGVPFKDVRIHVIGGGPLWGRLLAENTPTRKLHMSS